MSDFSMYLYILWLYLKSGYYYILIIICMYIEIYIFLLIFFLTVREFLVE